MSTYNYNVEAAGYEPWQKTLDATGFMGERFRPIVPGSCRRRCGSVRSRGGGFGGGLLTCFNHGLDLCEFNSLHEVFELGNARSHERRLRFTPIRDRLVKQLAHLESEFR